MLQKHFKPALGAIRLDALDTHTIQRFYNSLSASGLSPKTVKSLHGILHCALQQAIACDYIYRNPAGACKLPKVTKPEIKPLELEEIVRLLKEAEQDDYCNLFVVAMFTGMRQGELLGLPWKGSPRSSPRRQRSSALLLHYSSPCLALIRKTAIAQAIAVFLK